MSLATLMEDFMESILNSIKKPLGIVAEDKVFDADIIMHINSVFFDLNELGVGPSNVFYIEDDTSTWFDFMTDVTKFHALKSYMYLRVKLLFDPPSSSVVVESMKREIDKWEWRLTIAAETKF
jgi:hypothetical protein